MNLLNRFKPIPKKDNVSNENLIDFVFEDTEEELEQLINISFIEISFTPRLKNRAYIEFLSNKFDCQKEKKCVFLD